MQEALTIVIRYLLIALGAHLGTKYEIDGEVIDALVGAGVGLFAVIWVIKDRFWPKRPIEPSDESEEE